MSDKAKEVILELKMLANFMHDPRPKSSVLKAIELLQDARLNDDPLTGIKAALEFHNYAIFSEDSQPELMNMGNDRKLSPSGYYIVPDDINTEGE